MHENVLFDFFFMPKYKGSRIFDKKTIYHIVKNIL